MTVLLVYELYFHFTKVLLIYAETKSKTPYNALSKIKSLSWHLIMYFTTGTIMNVNEDIYNVF